MTDRMVVMDADITTLVVDAIHRTAGQELMAACRALGGCATGSAKVTPGVALPAKWVIHAVGPLWQGGATGEDGLLAGCYRAAMGLAAEKDSASIAFPAISTGVYRFPAERVAETAVCTVADALSRSPSIEKVIFACFGTASVAGHQEALDAI